MFRYYLYIDKIGYIKVDRQDVIKACQEGKNKAYICLVLPSLRPHWVEVSHINERTCKRITCITLGMLNRALKLLGGELA